jgi:hypothetical protein
LAETERVQDAVEVELRQAAGQVADAELGKKGLELGRGQVHATPLAFGGKPEAAVRTWRIIRHGYALAMSADVRIERGWIFVDGTRRDDGTIELGTGGEMRFSPFEAISQRRDAQITWGHILTASVQRLAFWRR